LKALPTVRDHTSNELNEEGDEYKPREYDENGEKKVAPNGAPLGGRRYRCRTFFMPDRGDKLFMLATECAKVLHYRDSYLLFNKNRSLFKIIANQAEKNDLIQQGILPSSYRSRQIAIVTARSMYRQFGSRLIENGRRVRDDYWESKARKQGFTEEDAAGEKRPGAAKAREAQAAAEASNAAAYAAIPHAEVVYTSNGPNPMDGSSSQMPLPMINLNPADDLGDYSTVQRPRHEITGSAYQDRTQPTAAAEIINQAGQTVDYNKNLNQQRVSRSKYLDDIWRRPHEPPPSQLPSGETDTGVSASQAHQSPHLQTASGLANHPSVGSHTPQQHHPMMTPQSYSQQPLHPGMVSQSPVRNVHQQLPSTQMQHRSPTFSMAGSNTHTQPTYGYPQGQMWPSAQSQPSPLPQTPMQYAQHLQQQSPHMQHTALQHPQMHHAGSGGSMHQMGYNVMAGGMNPPPYNVPRPMYQPSPGQQQQQQQHYMHQGSVAGTQPGMQGWSPAPSNGPQGQQNWQQGF
jgi:hypothetical protein